MQLFTYTTTLQRCSKSVAITQFYLIFEERRKKIKTDYYCFFNEGRNMKKAGIAFQ